MYRQIIFHGKDTGWILKLASLIHTINLNSIFGAEPLSLMLLPYSWKRKWKEVHLFTSTSVESYYVVLLEFAEVKKKPSGHDLRTMYSAADWDFIKGAVPYEGSATNG